MTKQTSKYRLLNFYELRAKNGRENIKIICFCKVFGDWLKIQSESVYIYSAARETSVDKSFKLIG